MQSLKLPPLGEDEVETIEGDVVAAGTSFDWATGLLTAIISGPELVRPSDWLPLVFGEGSFADSTDAQTKLTRLMRWYNEIGVAIRELRDPIRPDPDEIDGIEEFCQGYLEGASMQASWAADEEGFDLLLPFEILVGEIGEDDFREEDGRPIENFEAGMQGYRDDLGELLVEIYDYWADARVRRTPTVRAAPKTGRNEPCPCGSGKKYKRCCLT